MVAVALVLTMFASLLLMTRDGVAVCVLLTTAQEGRKDYVDSSGHGG